VWIFFFVCFGLVAFIRAQTFAEYHIKRSEPTEYLVGSLIMAKVVLIVDALRRRRTPRRRPLIYGTLWDTALYWVAALILHHTEQVISLMRHAHLSYAEANRQALFLMEQPVFLALMLTVLALTFAFCLIRELIRAIGEERFKEMFFGWHRREDLRRTA